MHIAYKTYYFPAMQQDIHDLFEAIYPDDPTKITRLCHNGESPYHVCTKVAYIWDNIVWQANVFYADEQHVLANLWYHVHPNFQQQGIGYALAQAVLSEAKTCWVHYVLIKTSPQNTWSIALAKKLWFVEIAKDDLNSKFTITRHPLTPDLLYFILAIYS